MWRLRPTAASERRLDAPRMFSEREVLRTATVGMNRLERGDVLGRNQNRNSDTGELANNEPR